ncbi:MAG: SPOR domain-containing protein [Candidatus Latescibacteria bacterium]|nr:SPOR domain-containing protein [Candidatus Latescibacterota bacterium]
MRSGNISRIIMVKGMLICLLLTVACAGGTPRFTDLPGQDLREDVPVVQKEDLAGELLVTPPRMRGEQAITENPESVLSLVGMTRTPPVVLPDTLPPMPDTSRVSEPTLNRGPRKEYQVQVAITPSADEAEDFKERLGPLLPGEEVFVIFTSPYYRIRVGRKTKREDADQLLAKLHELGYTGAMVIPVTITPDWGAG